jgi:hypothetical protein
VNHRARAARSPKAAAAVAAFAILCAASGASATAGAAIDAATGAAPLASAVGAATGAARPASATAATATGAARPADSTEDIRDIRGPQSVLPAWLLPALLAGGAVLAVGAYGVWRRRQRRRRARAPWPFEVALQRLEGVRALMQPQSARQFSTAVSDIVRSYIERSFELTATHRTTEEFLRDLLELPDSPLTRYRALLAEFLEQCDLVKFGDLSLTLQNMESLHQSACDFVRATATPGESARTGRAGAFPDPPQAHDSLPST